jgi:hypothetical protein
MQSYPGYHMNFDFGTKDPKPFMEIFPATVPIPALKHQVDPGTGNLRKIRPPRKTPEYQSTRPSYETSSLTNLSAFGPAQKAPLGSIVHARSGDKADNSNIGSFVRNDDEYTWLQSLLTVERLKALFGDDWFKCDPGRRIERVEIPKINAVHL